MNPDTNGRDGSISHVSGSTSLSLLERVRIQDPEAWVRLVKLYGPLVYLWARQSGVQPADASDVTQEVFAMVATRIEAFHRNRPGDSFRGWIWMITRNKVRDHFRQLRRQAPGRGGTTAQHRLTEIPESASDVSDADGPPRENAGLFRRAMELVRAGVEERTWQMFWQVTVNGRPVADVAEELGTTCPAVYKAKYRVVRQIRQELGDLIE